MSACRRWALGELLALMGSRRLPGRERVTAALFAGDARGADQAYHYPAGSCVALPDDAPPQLVPFDGGHHMEIVGELDLSDRSEIPTGAQERGLFDACAGQARTYLGADPVEPWRTGMETMSPESWAAGTRWVHCFLGRWDGAEEQIEVTGSARSVEG